MKRTYKIIVLLLSIATCSAKAQTGVDEFCKIIDRDKNAYITINKSSSMVYDLDFEACQNNQKVKDYFLKLLDVHEYLDYYMADFNQHQAGHLAHYLDLHFNRAYIDSVYRTPALLKHYSDMLRNWEESRQIKDFYYDDYTSFDNIMRIFTHLRYPEAYQKILANVNEKKDSEKFRELLRIMQDHEEWKQFLAEIQSDIRNESYSSEYYSSEYYSSEYLIKLMEEYNQDRIYGSSSVDFYLCMLDCKTKIYNNRCNCYDGSGGKDLPFNTILLCSRSKISDFLLKSEDPTIRDIFKTLLGNDSHVTNCFRLHPICKRLTSEELEDISDRIINNKEKITKLLEPLKKKLDEENNWWRSKIPYRKGE